MKLIPSIGIAFVIEDKKDYGETDIDIPEHMLKGVGTQGVIKWVKNDPDHKNQYKEGDHVVFSKFNEQICVFKDGNEEIYYSVPVQSIHAIIQDA